jgi:UDP-3-O-[3-hydroxymyristoyl] glucosamine N-acyltransferase
MSRERFFKKKAEYLELGKVVEIVGGKVFDKVDLSKKICDVATLENGNKGHISFLTGGSYVSQFKISKVEFCLVSEDKADKAPDTMITIICENPYYAYSLIAKELYEEREVRFNKSFFSKKNISKTAKIGKNCKIAPTAFIGDDVEIGDNCYVGPGVSIMPGCIIGSSTRINSNALISFCNIGDQCLIYSGARIGQDGFGFAHDKGVNHKITQLGIVEIGNNVEIGANSCVDRGAIENTKIGDGCKIDNLVQIAHNVEIGSGTVVAGCTAFAGSAKVGNYVQVGGNASIAGHIEIGDQSTIAGMSGVTKSLEPKSIVAGIPAVPIRKWHKMHSKLSKIVDGS